jgi:hypothetical protein
MRAAEQSSNAAARAQLGRAQRFCNAALAARSTYYLRQHSGNAYACAALAQALERQHSSGAARSARAAMRLLA